MSIREPLRAAPVGYGVFGFEHGLVLSPIGQNRRASALPPLKRDRRLDRLSQRIAIPRSSKLRDAHHNAKEPFNASSQYPLHHG